MYPDYNRVARDIILYFLKTYFPDPEKLMTPRIRVLLETDEEYLKGLFTGADYTENYKILIHQIRNHSEHIPPLVNAYMNLSPTMNTFGTAINHEFGEVEETGIMIKIPDIYPRKKERHLTTYMRRFSSWKNIKIRRRK
jgi:hypothetical protein